MKSSCLVRLSGNAQQPLPALGAAVGKKGVQPVPRQESPSYDRWPGYATLPLRYFLGVSGPAPTALPAIRVQVGTDGGVYAG